MSFQIKYPFTDPSNYQTLNAEIVSGKGQLALQNTPVQFIDELTSDSGFTYNSTNTEFVGSEVRQKNLYPDNLLSHRFDTKDLNFGFDLGASLICTLNGGASISGGKLVAPGATDYLEVPGSNLDFDNVGTIRFKYTPNYAGLPPTQHYIFGLGDGAGNNNVIRMQQFTNGGLYIYVYGTTGALLFSNNFGIWNQTMGQEYEFELNIDLTTGAHRLFIDGVQFGATNTSTGTRSGAGTLRLRLGTNNTGVTGTNGSFDDLEVFNTVQHTANYTPTGAQAPAFRYGSDAITFPLFLDTILSISSLVSVDSGSPRFTLDGLWWNGANWVASNLTYAESNTKATINANMGTFPFSATQLQVGLYWTDTNTQTSIDQLLINYASWRYNDGRVIPAAAFYSDNIVSIAASTNAAGLDEVRFLLEIGGAWYWWNGGAWAISNLTQAETNDLATFNANIGTALTVESICRVICMLYTDTTLTTPDIDELTVEYDFNFANLPAPSTTAVYGFIRDAKGEKMVGATVSFAHDSPLTSYREIEDHVISKAAAIAITDSDGEFSLPLVPGNYKFIAYKGDDWGILKKADGTDIIVTIPLQQEVNVTDQISP